MTRLLDHAAEHLWWRVFRWSKCHNFVLWRFIDRGVLRPLEQRIWETQVRHGH